MRQSWNKYFIMVPSAGLIMLSLVLTQAGLPVEGIALILGVDRLLDMVRTAVNVTGDATVSTVVAYHGRQLEGVVFNGPDSDIGSDDEKKRAASWACR